MIKKKSNNIKWYAATTVAVVAMIIFIGLPTLGYEIKLPSFSGFLQDAEKPQIEIDPSEQESTEYWVDLRVEPTRICVAESSNGHIISNMPHALCLIQANSGSGFKFYQNAVLDSTGRYSRAQIVYVAGTSQLRALCADSNGNYRISNTATLVVDDCDSDGDGFTNSEEIEAGTDPFDQDDYPVEITPLDPPEGVGDCTFYTPEGDYYPHWTNSPQPTCYDYAYNACHVTNRYYLTSAWNGDMNCCWWECISCGDYAVYQDYNHWAEASTDSDCYNTASIFCGAKNIERYWFWQEGCCMYDCMDD